MFGLDISTFLFGAASLSVVSGHVIVGRQASQASKIAVQACYSVNPICSASGYSAEYYANPSNTYGSPYTGINSNYYIGQAALKQSFTNLTFFPQDFGQGPGYTRITNGGIVVDGNNFTMVYTGFFRAPESGTWQICGSADNENDIYFGDGNAFNCTSGKPSKTSTPLVKAFGGYNSNPTSCFSVDLLQGLFYPIRSVMGNYGGPSVFNMSFVPPSGSTLQRSNLWTGFAFPPSCGLTGDVPLS